MILLKFVFNKKNCYELKLDKKNKFTMIWCVFSKFLFKKYIDRIQFVWIILIITTLDWSCCWINTKNEFLNATHVTFDSNSVLGY